MSISTFSQVWDGLITRKNWFGVEVRDLYFIRINKFLIKSISIEDYTVNIDTNSNYNYAFLSSNNFSQNENLNFYEYHNTEDIDFLLMFNFNFYFKPTDFLNAEGNTFQFKKYKSIHIMSEYGLCYYNHENALLDEELFHTENKESYYYLEIFPSITNVYLSSLQTGNYINTNGNIEINIEGYFDDEISSKAVFIKTDISNETNYCNIKTILLLNTETKKRKLICITTIIDNSQSIISTTPNGVSIYYDWNANVLSNEKDNCSDYTSFFRFKNEENHRVLLDMFPPPNYESLLPSK